MKSDFSDILYLNVPYSNSDHGQTNRNGMRNSVKARKRRDHVHM